MILCCSLTRIFEKALWHPLAPQFKIPGKWKENPPKRSVEINLVSNGLTPFEGSLVGTPKSRLGLFCKPAQNHGQRFCDPLVRIITLGEKSGLVYLIAQVLRQPYAWLQSGTQKYQSLVGFEVPQLGERLPLLSASAKFTPVDNIHIQSILVEIYTARKLNGASSTS